MKRNKDTLTAKSNGESRALFNEQAKLESTQLGNRSQSHRELDARTGHSQVAHKPTLSQQEDYKHANDIALRMSYQSAHSLLNTQLEKRNGIKAPLKASQTAKAATHYPHEVSSASKAYSSQNDSEMTYIANSYVVATPAPDDSALPNARLQYLSLNDLDSLKALTGTDTDNFDGFDSDITLESSTVEDEDAKLESLLSEIQHPNFKRHPNDERQLMTPDNIENHTYNSDTMTEQPQIAERLFMSSLVKHTAIALAIIVPLAAVTAYAAEPTVPGKQNANAVATATSNTANTDLKTSNNTPIRVGQVATESMAGMANPATVESVDLSRYAGQWYEIARLPMYFQRNCAADVTATYKPNADSDSITVVNKCISSSGKEIVANGEAVPADASGSKLKVTFLPSWLRWAPFGKADYWVLALDDDYKTALVGTPNKKYLWLLSRSPSMDTDTYQTYRKIAQNQGYNLTDFTLTPQTVK